jgi:hypothetical protein
MLGAMPQEGSRLVDPFRIIVDVGTKIVLQPDEILSIPETATVGKPS